MLARAVADEHPGNLAAVVQVCQAAEAKLEPAGEAFGLFLGTYYQRGHVSALPASACHVSWRQMPCKAEPSTRVHVAQAVTYEDKQIG